jgi:hypothetical protein
MIQAHLEENRGRREENEKRIAAQRWGRTFSRDLPNCAGVRN